MPHADPAESVRLEPGWKALLAEELRNDYFQELRAYVRQRYREATVYPPPGLIFNAFDQTPPGEVKAVILGQDPYHQPGQAHGLCFSVQPGVAPPPSVRNIFKELQDDLGCEIPEHGHLMHWAREGVLLLNTHLTVERGQPGAHAKIGWSRFTAAALARLAESRQHIAFLLWGRHAQERRELIPAGDHLILTAAHPSPFAAHKGFFGCRHFSRANAYLQENGIPPVDWCLPAD
jgi:uracil-DNA glycosylase